MSTAALPWCEDIPQGDAAQAAVRELTRREREVSEHVGHGRSNAEIARLLDIQRRTVEFHLSNVYRKLGLFRRAQLAALVASTAASGPTSARCQTCGCPVDLETGADDRYYTPDQRRG